MLFEPTSLATTTTALAAALETYGCDVRAVFAEAGLDFDEVYRPGARYPVRSSQRLWAVAREASGDPCIGLAAGRCLKPQALHALGLSWMASRTMLDGFGRMARYARIANTSLRIDVTEQGHEVCVSADVIGNAFEPSIESIDATLAFIVTLCRFITNKHFSPVSVSFRHAANEHTDQYVEFFGAPVFFSKSRDAICFDAEMARALAPAGNEELAQATDRIGDRYLATLESASVQHKVKSILLTLLPSGQFDQQVIADRLNRSVSTLQRQLRAEGASYRQVLDETRQQLAERLIRENEYSLGQIAYLLGFADQANFSRAFKRWTGNAPTEYRR